jgi:hypothetical protein
VDLFWHALHFSSLELHLKRYNERRYEFYSMLLDGPRRSPFFGNVADSIQSDVFSNPHDKDGYNDTSISNDMITDVYLHWVERERKAESERLLRMQTGGYIWATSSWLVADEGNVAVCLSIDHTYRMARKAKVTSSNNEQSDVFSGGMFQAINENNIILAWVRTDSLYSVSNDNSQLVCIHRSCARQENSKRLRSSSLG